MKSGFLPRDNLETRKGIHQIHQSQIRVGARDFDLSDLLLSEYIPLYLTEDCPNIGSADYTKDFAPQPDSDTLISNHIQLHLNGAFPMSV